MKFNFLLLSLLASQTALSQNLEVGALAPKLVLEGADGARLDDKPWDSDSIKGQVTSVIYIDPEEKSKNEPLEEMYKREKFGFDTHKSVGIINMAAAWYPNAMIENVIKQKQKEFPNTVYVKDKKKVLVSKWGLKDDSVNLIVFDKEGKVAYLSKEPVAESEFPKLIKIIRDAMAK